MITRRRRPIAWTVAAVAGSVAAAGLVAACGSSGASPALFNSTPATSASSTPSDPLVVVTQTQTSKVIENHTHTPSPRPTVTKTSLRTKEDTVPGPTRTVIDRQTVTVTHVVTVTRTAASLPAFP